MTEGTIAWCLEGPDWLAARVREDLLDEEVGRPALSDPEVTRWIDEVAAWPWPAVKGHKTLALPLHKLAFLADIGLRYDDPRISGVVDGLLTGASPEGPIRIVINLPKAFGGSGRDEPAWFLTDAPVVAGALARMGLAGDARIVRAADHLEGLVRDNGWPCAASPELGPRFKGPGKREDPCPYANLVMLRFLSIFPGRIASSAADRGIATLLDLWERRGEARPYMFGMGTDFLKLKAPFVWYDILHLLEVLSRYPRAIRDVRFREILDLAEGKADDRGRFTPESIYRPAAGFDFGQKKEPSRWITFIMMRIRRRVEAAGT